MIKINIQWLGNSTFLIKTSLSKKILIDPFSPLQILNIDTAVDIITLSKDFHDITEYNSNNLCNKLIFNDETYNDNYIKIKGYLSFSDKMNGLKEEKTIYILMKLMGLNYAI